MKHLSMNDASITRVRSMAQPLASKNRKIVLKYKHRIHNQNVGGRGCFRSFIRNDGESKLW